MSKKAKSFNLNFSSSRHYINKLNKQKICTLNLSFQNTKNMLFIIEIKGAKGKNFPRQYKKDDTAFCSPKIPLSKNLKI